MRRLALLLILLAGCEQPMPMIAFVGDGQTDNLPAMQAWMKANPGGAYLHLASGVYNFSGQVNLSPMKWATITGDGWYPGGGNYGTILKCTGSASPFINFNSGAGNGTVCLRDIYFISGSGSTTISLVGNGASGGGVNSPVIDHIQVQVPSNGIGLLISNCFNAEVRGGCIFRGGDFTGTGIYSQNNSPALITSCRVTSNNVGILANGPGTSIKSSGIETNKIGLWLGANPDGTNSYLSNSVIEGIEGEANDIFIYAQNVSSTKFVACRHHGSVGSPSGMSQIGFKLYIANGCTLDALQVEGAYADTCYRIGDTSNQCQHVCMDACQASNGGTGTLSVIGSGVVDLNKRACNFP